MVPEPLLRTTPAVAADGGVGPAVLARGQVDPGSPVHLARGGVAGLGVGAARLGPGVRARCHCLCLECLDAPAAGRVPPARRRLPGDDAAQVVLHPEGVHRALRAVDPQDGQFPAVLSGSRRGAEREHRLQVAAGNGHRRGHPGVRDRRRPDGRARAAVAGGEDEGAVRACLHTRGRAPGHAEAPDGEVTAGGDHEVPAVLGGEGHGDGAVVLATDRRVAVVVSEDALVGPGGRRRVAVGPPLAQSAAVAVAVPVEIHVPGDGRAGGRRRRDEHRDGDQRGGEQRDGSPTARPLPVLSSHG